MNGWKAFVFVLAILLAVGLIYGTVVIRGGFSATDQPSRVETVMARTVRNLGIPRGARNQTNPVAATSEVLHEAYDIFTDRCAGCHGKDGDGQTGIGPNLYPKAPDCGVRMPRI
jgi:mono/diheme cytochrome c family protein